MSGEPFSLDTNILVYAHDNQSREKHEMAKAIVTRAARSDCRLGLQAVSEFYVVVTRKAVVTQENAQRQIENWMSVFPMLTASAAAVRSAMSHAVAGRASYWDALLIETAAEGGCAFLLTEDLADGARFGPLTVVHPFRAGGLTPRAIDLLS